MNINLRVTKHEHLRYWVESESGEKDYLVDLLAWRCECMHWQTQVQTGQKKFCKHLCAATLHMGLDFLSEVRKQTKTMSKIPK